VNEEMGFLLGKGIDYVGSNGKTFFVREKMNEATTTYFKAMLKQYTQGLSKAVVTQLSILRGKVKNYPHFYFSNLFTQK
jgi:hypothetical protein